MSLFSSINTAISGLTSQSANFGNISEDVANSQTVGFKRVDTSFIDYLTTSTPLQNQPGAVVARPDYINNVQGSVMQTDNPLGLAIAGQGFFPVSQSTGAIGKTPTFDPQPFYTRAGDFTMNNQGYLVNSAGQYLNAWKVDPTTGSANQNAVVPVQINQSSYNPVATSNVTLSANLPATPAAGTAVSAYGGGGTETTPAVVDPNTGLVTTPAVDTIPAQTAKPLSSQITVYDALGTAHAVTLNWTQKVDASNVAIADEWNVQIQVAGAAFDTAGNPIAKDANGNTSADVGSADVTFGSASGNVLSDGTTPIPEGTIGSIASAADGLGLNPIPADQGSVVPGNYVAGQAATLRFTTNFGSGPQSITLDLGTYGGTTGVTQYAATKYSLLGLTQDGIPPGNFSNVTTQANGNIIVNYNNGQSRTIAQIPLVTFNDPNKLQSQNGQSFTATEASGAALAKEVGTNGAGTLVTSSVEGSNVDIATEFSNLIVAQQAYSSNAKVVTTANQMLQTTLQMVQG